MVTYTLNRPASEVRGGFMSALQSFFSLTGAAIRCAASVESGHRPNQRDLVALGMGEVMTQTDTPQIGR